MVNTHNAPTILSGRFYAHLFLLCKLVIYSYTRLSSINKCIILSSGGSASQSILSGDDTSLLLLGHHCQFCNFIIIRYCTCSKRYRSFLVKKRRRSHRVLFAFLSLYHRIVVQDWRMQLLLLQSLSWYLESALCPHFISCILLSKLCIDVITTLVKPRSPHYIFCISATYHLPSTICI